MKRLHISGNNFYIGMLLVNILMFACSCSEKEGLKKMDEVSEKSREEATDEYDQKLTNITEK